MRRRVNDKTTHPGLFLGRRGNRRKHAETPSKSAAFREKKGACAANALPTDELRDECKREGWNAMKDNPLSLASLATTQIATGDAVTRDGKRVGTETCVFAFGLIGVRMTRYI